MNLVNPVQVVKTSNNFQGGFCYCVDEYGRQTEQEVDELDVGELDCPDHCLPPTESTYLY